MVNTTESKEKRLRIKVDLSKRKKNFPERNCKEQRLPRLKK